MTAGPASRARHEPEFTKGSRQDGSRSSGPTPRCTFDPARHLIERQARHDGGGLRSLDLGRRLLWRPPEAHENGRRRMAAFTIGGNGNFATITEALASGSVGPGD